MVFITGTGTDVGKTFVATWLCAHLQWSYWKPLQTGVTGAFEGDTAFVAKYAKVHTLKEQYRFTNPHAPECAALAENIYIDFHQIKKPSTSPLIIEGAGGIYVPITHDHMMIDLIKSFTLPVIVVASTELGTINHTIATLKGLQELSIPVLGVIMSGAENAYNAQSIEHFGKTQVLATLPYISTSMLAQEDCFFKIPLPIQVQNLLGDLHSQEGFSWQK